MVSRANAAAVTLERAWERWRIMHGLPATARSPVSSYVGYSIEEPWGSPRVVFGVDAGEAELLAALLERHECSGQSYRPGPAASVLDQPAYAGDSLYQATRARVSDPRMPDPRMSDPRLPEPRLTGQRQPAAPVTSPPSQFAATPEQLPAAAPEPANATAPPSGRGAPGEPPDMEIPGQGSLLPELAGALATAAGHPATAGHAAGGGQPAAGDEAPPGVPVEDGEQPGGLLRAAGGDLSASPAETATGGEAPAREAAAAVRARRSAGDRDGNSGRGGNSDLDSGGDRGRQGRSRDAATRRASGRMGSHYPGPGKLADPGEALPVPAAKATPAEPALPLPGLPLAGSAAGSEKLPAQTAPAGALPAGTPRRDMLARGAQERPTSARTGRGKGGPETIAAELAGWASSELPGQASARLAAWEAIGGVPAADTPEGSPTSLRAAGLGSPLDAPERGTADIGTTAEPVR
jgi:hypothetical protein